MTFQAQSTTTQPAAMPSSLALVTTPPADQGGTIPTVSLPHPVVRVRTIGQPEEWTDWHIFQDLTDRWGEVNWYDAAKKPIDHLENDPDLLKRLTDQMWDEITFIVCKDGKFGVLFETEYCSSESEKETVTQRNSQESSWYKSLKPQAVVIKALLTGLQMLAERSPGVQFGVPDEATVFNGRPAAWAFVPDGLLNAEQRKELGTALLAL